MIERWGGLILGLALIGVAAISILVFLAWGAMPGALTFLVGSLLAGGQVARSGAKR